MNSVRTPLRGADHALAVRDDALPCLAAVLDDDRLSELLGGPARITRVRYKPRTSVLVAFCRTRGGQEDYGWALTTAGNTQLAGRARKSERRGGGVQLLRPALADADAVIAVGGVDDDWALLDNLRWLRNQGLELLGAGLPSERGFPGGSARVVRYKPERRVVLVEQTPGSPIVVKTAARAVPETAGRFHQRLLEHGVPVLRLLGDADTWQHGTTASPLWGDRDLSASDNPEAARAAGEALARLHSLPTEGDAGPAGSEALVERQMAATCAMVAALLPDLEAAAAAAAARIRQRLDAVGAWRTPVRIHGDFSADQVLVSGSEVRLIDFDRAHNAAAEADLGSFAAVAEMSRWRDHPNASVGPETRHLIDGYVQAGGRFNAAAVDFWAALRMFAGCVDPFRDRAADWATDMSRHIDRACELVR